MCESGTKKEINIRNQFIEVDECMIPLVKALNINGLETVGCCCGHGKAPGWIHLADDSYLILAPVRDQFIIHKYAIWELIKDKQCQ